jgi:hypothetical protein
MAGVNSTNVGLTLIHYLDDVDQSLNFKSEMRKAIKQNYDWNGAYLEWRVHVRPSGAIGGIDDGGQFPVPGAQVYATSKVGRRMTAGSIQLTDGVMAAASKSKAVAKDVVSSEMEGLMTELGKYENIMLFKNGDGSLCTVQTGTASTTLIVDDARALWEGVTYSVYDTTLATYRGDLTISAVANDPTAAGYATVTVDALPSGTTATDKIVWKGSVNKAITGLTGLLTDSGTFQNILATTYPKHTSLIADASANRDLTPTLLRQFQAALYQKTGNDDPSKVLTVYGSAGMMINMDELFEDAIRVTPDSGTSGMSAPRFQSSFGTFEVKPNNDAPFNQLIFADLSQIYRGVQKKLGWRVEKNGSIFKRSDLTAVHTATALEIAELYIRERISSGRLTNLNEPTKLTMY